MFMARGASWRGATLVLLAALTISLTARDSLASNYASVVMDARSGRILFSENPDKILNPASLTKMMTVYIVIQAVENGEISLDHPVRISKFAASEPASKLYLRAGSRVSLRYLIRAAAIRSANDAATAIAEAISGSEKDFADRMTRTARAMGMSNTTFRNAHGLTQKGHLSTARDMSLLGRRVIYDYPEYYNLFSRRSAHVGSTTVRNTNRRFLNAYKGADGIKTGYTSKAGFNLVASAARGPKRIIVTVFGGRSAKTRNQHVAELMDRGFARAATHVELWKPARLEPVFGKIRRVDVSVDQAERRRRRPADIEAVAGAVFESLDQTDVAIHDDTGFLPGSESDVGTLAVASLESTLAAFLEGEGDVGPALEILASLKQGPETFAIDYERPLRRPVPPGKPASPYGQDESVWAVGVGSFNTSEKATHHLLKAALVDFSSLGNARRTVIQGNGAFTARFEGMSRSNAEVACGRLRARDMKCEVISSSSL